MNEQEYKLAILGIKEDLSLQILGYYRIIRENYELSKVKFEDLGGIKKIF